MASHDTSAREQRRAIDVRRHADDQGLGCAVSLFSPASPCGEALLTLLARIPDVNVASWGVQNQSDLNATRKLLCSIMCPGSRIVNRFPEVNYVIPKEWRLKARRTSMAIDAGHALRWCETGCGTSSTVILLRADLVIE